MLRLVVLRSRGQASGCLQGLPSALNIWPSFQHDHQPEQPGRSIITTLPASQPPWIAATSLQSRGMAWWSSSKPKAGSSIDQAQPALPFQEDPPQVPEAAVAEPVVSLNDKLPLDTAAPEAVSAIQDACGAVEAAALAAARDDSIYPARWFIDAILAVHEQGQLPWWASIMLVNAVVRTITFPVILASQKATANMAAMNLELMPMKKLQEATLKASTFEERARLQEAWMAESGRIQIKYGPSIRKTMATMLGTLTVNTLVFVSIFNGVSNLMLSKAPSLTEGGLTWFHDLTVSDPYYGLPILCTLTTLGMVQYGMSVTGEQMANSDQAGQAQRVKNIFRFFALLFIPFGAYVPAGVALLWVSNSMFSVLAGVLMRQDAFRAAVGLPTLEHLRNISSQLQSMATKDPTSFVPSAAASGAGGSAASAAYPGAGAGSAQGASVWPQATTGSSSSSSSSSALNSGGIQVPPPPGTPAQVAQEAQVGGQPPQPSEADMQMLQELIAQLQQQQEEGTQPKPES